MSDGASGAGTAEGTTPEGGGSWSSRLAAHGVDVLFLGIVVATLAYYYRVTSDIWFFADEWAMADQVRLPSQLFDPYNGHLSILILGLYRVLLGIFGFTTHDPYRLAGLVSLASVSVAFFASTRRRLGAPLAAIGALVLLWPSGISLEAGGLNHPLALLGGVVCAHGLCGQGRRRDLVVAAGLIFALCSAGGGVAVAVAAAVHSIVTRAGVRRWAAVAIPSLAWLVWWKAMVPTDPPEVKALRPGVADIVGPALGDAWGSFAALALGNRAGGVVLFVAFLLVAALRLRQGLAAAANVVAWSAALVFWWVGLHWSRGFVLDDEAFRYEFVSMGFILLAVLPVRDVAATGPGPTAWLRGRGLDLPGPSVAFRVVAGPLLVGVAAVLLVLSVRPDLLDFAATFGAYGRTSRLEVDVLGVPDQVPGATPLSFSLGNRTAAQLRELLAVYGAPSSYGEPNDIVARSARLHDAGRSRIADGENCSPLATVRPTPPDTLDLRSAEGAPRVEVRRFGSDWVPIGSIAPGGRARLELPASGAAAPWQVRAPGACLVG